MCWHFWVWLYQSGSILPGTSSLHGWRYHEKRSSRVVPASCRLSHYLHFSIPQFLNPSISHFLNFNNSRRRIIALERLNEVGQIIAQMGRLIVAHILPRNAHTVSMVVHQGWNTIFGCRYRRINVQRSIVCGATEYHFLPPVTKDIRYQTWSCFRSIARSRAVQRGKHCTSDT